MKKVGLETFMTSSPLPQFRQARHSWVDALPAEARHGLLSISERVRGKRGAVLFEEGNPATRLFVILEGAAGIVRRLPEGGEQLIGFLFAGDVTGFMQSGRYVYGARLLGEAELLVVPRREFEALCERHPVIGHRLLEMAINELAAAQDHLVMLGRKSARERVATFLLQLNARTGGQEDEASLWLPMRRGEIAEHLGLSLETVSRVMSEFAAQDLIEIKGRRLVHLRDRRTLALLAEGF